uniref:Dual specificity phosphatase 29 n=2 Tax=Paralichthys olivaceus TaxID=8255 RepID=A0A9E9P836_PAROL|nr:dual-specificity phosphatase 26a [Paralichthys olivaceus]
MKGEEEGVEAPGAARRIRENARLEPGSDASATRGLLLLRPVERMEELREEIHESTWPRSSPVCRRGTQKHAGEGNTWRGQPVGFTSCDRGCAHHRRVPLCSADIKNPQMAFMSRFSRSRSSSRSPSRKDSERVPPNLSVSELERLLYTGKTACNHADEVWPRLYIGDQDIASDRRELAKLGITHILNCAQSKWRGGAEYYAGMNITYHGIEAHDSPTFDMSVNFYPAAEFIHKALTSGGKVLVHCTVGVSRSATLVLAYLMIRQNLTLVEAIKTVKDHRGVIPNRGFLRQLNGLDGILRESRKTSPQS